MTSQSTSIYTPFADGRTVHDIVEHSPALVSERWCKNLLRQVLQSLEQQYASGAPHRRITPDTLVMLNNEEALLLPSSEDGAAVVDAIDAAEPGESTLAADLHALATVVHYAITAELPPDGPIGPRLYDDYSDQLTKGIDRCLGPNLRLRPKSIAEMRELLGLEETPGAVPDAPSVSSTSSAPAATPPQAATDQPVVEAIHVPASEPAAAPGQDAAIDFSAPDRIAPVIAPVIAPTITPTMAPSMAPQATIDPLAQAQGHAPAPREPAAPQAAHVKTAAAPASARASRKPGAAQPAQAPGQGRVQRWAMMAGAAVVLLAAGSALVAFLQQSDSRDVAALSLPPAEGVANGLDQGGAAQAAAVAPDTAPAQPPGANAGVALPADGSAAAPGMAAATVPGAMPATAAAPAAVPPASVPGAASGRIGDAVVNGTTYKLLIKPWGTIYVNGVDRGVSPPVKRLTLGPGTHTIQIVNPNFPEHVRTLTAGTEEGATIEHDFTAQAE